MKKKTKSNFHCKHYYPFIKHEQQGQSILQLLCLQMFVVLKTHSSSSKARASNPRMCK